MRAMVAKGHEVMACSGEPLSEVVETLHGWDVRYEPIHLSRTGMRPWQDLRTCWELYRLMRRFQPDVVLAYTIKPVIWGGFAAWLAGVPGVYSLITGLGYAFVPGKRLRGMAMGLVMPLLYRLNLKISRKVFFQNPDDMHEFLVRRLVKAEQCRLVNGSGVDLVHYGLADLPSAPRFLMLCRLLGDKGVREYVEAARSIRKRCANAIFRLAGAPDSNPSSVSQAELEQWKTEDVIDYLGELSDVRPAYVDCSILVLPSYYREGIPRAVLEAMSMGRPIITTNAAGCRETIKLPQGQILDKASQDIVQGENGFLVPVKSVDKLVHAMERFLDDPALIEKMGRRSREFAVEKYDVHKVNAVMLESMGLV